MYEKRERLGRSEMTILPCACERIYFSNARKPGVRIGLYVLGKEELPLVVKVNVFTSQLTNRK